MSAIKLRIAVPDVSALHGPTILTKALDVLNRPPSPTPEQVRYAHIYKQVSQELQHLLNRARIRSYSDTMPVLSFYWLLTIRQRHSADHFALIEGEIDKLLANPYLSAPELQALQGCKQWVRSARFAEPRKRRPSLPAAPFTSERYAPPEFATQAFLENLLNTWLPQSILETYGQRLVEDSWTNENAYAEAAFCLEEILRRRAVFPEIDVVRRFDKLQKRTPTSEEDLAMWRRRQQASLESLALVSGKDASCFDPKLREI
ncbi:MAG: hypothetical protein JO022_16400, partial [Acidobacteriaceae bacterium]|nr:hypothetical protein [Acidobacteriaceae bacterium]